MVDYPKMREYRDETQSKYSHGRSKSYQPYSKTINQPFSSAEEKHQSKQHSYEYKGKHNSNINGDANDELLAQCTSKVRITPNFFTITINITLLFVHSYYLIKSCGFSLFPIVSFSQLSFVSTAIYYALFLFSSKAALEWNKRVIVYLTFLINGLQLLNVFLIPVSHRPDQLLTHYQGLKSQTPNFFTLGTKLTIWLPIAQWCLFQFSHRRLITLMIWEFRASLSLSSQRWLYKTYIFFCPMLSLLAWELIRPLVSLDMTSLPINLNDHWTDLPSLDRPFTALIISWLASALLLIWISFNTFQYRGIVWTSSERKGFLVYKPDVKFHLASIY